MSHLTAPPSRPLRSSKRSRVAVRTTRPAIVDLRFREDAWIVENEGRAQVCLGDYHLSGLAVTCLDLPGLNNLFIAIRVGQARRQMENRRKGA